MRGALTKSAGSGRVVERGADSSYPWERVVEFTQAADQRAAVVSQECQQQVVFEQLCDEQQRQVY